MQNIYNINLQKPSSMLGGFLFCTQKKTIDAGKNCALCARKGKVSSKVQTNANLCR